MLAATASPSETTQIDTPPPAPSGLEGGLYDASALAIVVAGTLFATLARAGLSDTRIAIASGLALAQKGYDEDANRTAFARWAHAIRERGVLGAEKPMPKDADLARALTALVRTGSIKALRGAHEDSRARHMRESGRAVRVFEQAGELAPVFGLVGTLFSMTQLAPGASVEASALTLGAIATAVLSSLYGVMAAHFIFLPLGHAIARRAQREEDAREDLIEWLADEIAEAVPGGSPARIARLTKVA